MEFPTRPPKRLASVLDDGITLSKRPETCRSDASTTSAANSLVTAPSAMEIRAYGLEDRAEAVISRGKESWTLANLSKWRHDTLDNAVNSSDSTQSNSKRSSKEYLRQRQRAYRHQCLAFSNRDQHKHSDS